MEAQWIGPFSTILFYLLVLVMLCSFFLFSIQRPFLGDFHPTGMQEVLSHSGRSGLTLLIFTISSPDGFAGFWVSDSSNRCCLVMGWELGCLAGSVRVDTADKRTVVQDVGLCRCIWCSAAGLVAGWQRREGSSFLCLIFPSLSQLFYWHI